MNIDWYWNNGLHDAVIKEIKQVELTYDYTKPNPLRNVFEIILDAKSAMFDTSVKRIRLYNYKLLNDFGDVRGFWWVSDMIEGKAGKIMLCIKLSSTKEDKEVKIIFEKAEVER